MLYFFLLISFCFAEDLSIVTSNSKGNIQEDGKFRLMNIPKSLEMRAHTFCLRFKTVRFAGLQCLLADDDRCLLETVAAEKCGGNDMKCFSKQNIIKSAWDTKKVFALWPFSCQKVQNICGFCVCGCTMRKARHFLAAPRPSPAAG